jgi:hypothetical protein
MYLAPHRVALTRLKRGMSGQVIASRQCDVANGSAGNPSASFACLTDLLTDSQWQDASARVILADSWVRYGLVPAPAVTLDTDGRLSHAPLMCSPIFLVTAWLNGRSP